MSLEIRLPIAGTTSGKDLEEVYDLVQKTPELGFIYRTVLVDDVRSNKEEGKLWAAYLDGTLVGVATIGSHRAYPHVAKHGEITVLPEFRRRRIGTCLYFVQVLNSILKGRREIEDTIIPALSPWMAGLDHITHYTNTTVKDGCVDGVGFLPSLGYSYYGTLPGRTKAFKDIMLFGGSPVGLVETYMNRIPDMLSTIRLNETPKMKADFDKNVEGYNDHGHKELVEQITDAREWVRDTFDVQVIE